jgi:glycosyltransferase involved in cell wall biosynthesis
MSSSPIRVLFDGEIFATQRYGGISRYFIELMKRLPNFGVIPRLVVPISFSEYLAATPQIYCGFSSSRFQIRGAVRLTTLASRFSDHLVPKLVSHDLVHHTFYARKAISRKPAVCTIHDMIPEVLPSQFPLGNPHQGKFEMAQRCSGIIAVSDATRADMLRLMPGLKAKVVTIPEAVDVAQFRRLSQSVAQVSGDYVLFVGYRHTYKNFSRFAEAVAPILASNAGLRLFCVGGGPFTDSEVLPFRKAGVLHRVEQRQVTDEQLASLYNGARCFVFPSLYEGFGLPILEAFSLGTPVALSDTPCFREVAGNAAVYFDPEDVSSIREAIAELLKPGAPRRELIAKGTVRLAKFSWERTADLTARAYRDLL